MGVPHLQIYTDEVVDFGLAQRQAWVPQNEAEAFAHAYEQDADAFKDLFLTISQGGLLEPEKTDAIVDAVLNRQHDAAHIVDCVMQVRTVDEYTYHHCVNVSMLAMMLGKWMRIPSPDLAALVRAGLLHDVGKSRIPLPILNKPGPLDTGELVEMKRHAEYGYQLVRLSPGVKPEVAIAVLTHHEREDGTGYPLALRADKLGLFAKILAIVDVFDAMTANRIYRRHEPVFRVFELMQHGSFGRMDPIVLQVFLTNITHYYVGRRVRLSDGTSGEVIFMNQLDFSRPVVQTQKGFVDLLAEKGLSIVEIG
jgi:putative nucleotidyltransferase with HDIG domain